MNIDRWSIKLIELEILLLTVFYNSLMNHESSRVVNIGFHNS